MWTKGDSAQGLNWQEALAWVQAKNAENYLGHDDWRLPNAKELQSIVDYTRSPDTTSSAAIDPALHLHRRHQRGGAGGLSLLLDEHHVTWPVRRGVGAAPSTSPSDGPWAT
ncbi:MAG: DUF1566 domain-containing protein [Candidatus Moduliflexus flocculans]|nr:DUF1566 domain-containing protein [Candidatus Moduliflexus flocculans]